MKYENRNYSPVVIIKRARNNLSDIKYLPQNVLLQRQRAKKQIQQQMRQEQMKRLQLHELPPESLSGGEESKRQIVIAKGQILEKTAQKQKNKNGSFIEL